MLVDISCSKKFRWKAEDNCRREQKGGSRVKRENRKEKREKRSWGKCFQSESVELVITQTVLEEQQSDEK